MGRNHQEGLADPQPARLAELCRARGIPLTPQRAAIYAALCASREHPTAEQIWKQARRRLPTLSLATVYKNLEALKALGLLGELPGLGGAVRFDPQVERHHHLSCLRCGRVIDLPAGSVRAPAPEAARERGWQPVEVRVQIEGICPGCRD